MLFQILAIILAIAFGVCIVAFIRQLYKSHSRDHLSKYLKTWKKDNRILLRSMVFGEIKKDIIPILYMVLVAACFLVMAYLETPSSIVGVFLLCTFAPLLLCFILAAPQAATQILLTSDSIIIKHYNVEDMIPYADIKNISIAKPGRPKHRTLGTTGMLGYFGKWEDEENGQYIACFGKRNKCFLITTETGLKYMLGCNHPNEVVNFVRKRLKQPKNKKRL